MFTAYISPLKCVAAFALGLAIQIGASHHANDAERLVGDLKQGTATQKCQAADRICSCDAPASTFAEALRIGMRDENASVRWHCARTIGVIGLDDEATRDQLVNGLADEEVAVQIHSARALAQIGDQSPETVRALVAMATNADGRIARVAIAALREIQADRKMVVAAIADVLDSDEHAVAMHAVEALVERGADSVPFLIEALANERAGYWAAIAIEQIGPDAKATVPHLTRLLQSAADLQVRVHTLLALAAMGEAAHSVCPQIVDVLESPKQDSAVRAAAAYALGSIGCTKADQQLRAATTADDQLLAMIAAWALANTHPDDEEALNAAVDKLTTGLASDDPRIRTAAAKGLHRLDPPPEIAAPALIAVAADPDPSVMANVIDALASLGQPVLPHAARALKNPELRDVSVAVIARLGADAAEAVPALAQAYDPDDPEFTAQIQLALAEIGAAAAPTVDKLATSLLAQDERLRHSAIYALGRIGTDAAPASASLQKLLGSSDVFERSTAAWALTRIQPGNKDLARTIKPHLIAGLESDSAELRLESALALGSLGIEATNAVPALKQLASDDPSVAVREAAAEALESIRN